MVLVAFNLSVAQGSSIHGLRAYDEHINTLSRCTNDVPNYGKRGASDEKPSAAEDI